MERLNTPLSKIIFKNAILSTIGSIALKVVYFLYNVYVVRKLGDDRFGQYSTILSFVTLFQIFAEFGMTQYVMREVARDHSKTQVMFWNLIFARLLLSFLSVIGITTAAYFMDYPPMLLFGIFLYTWMFALASIHSPLETILTAYERFDIVTIMSVVGQSVYVLFGALFLFSGKNFLWLIVAGFIGLIPPITIGLWAVLKNKLLTLRPNFSPKSWFLLMRAGLPFGISSLTMSITYSIDTVILSKFYAAEVIGWYRVAFDLVSTLLFFTGGFHKAIVPSLSRVFASEPEEIGRWYHRAVRIFILISLPLAFGGMVLAKSLIIFLYTDVFLPSVNAFQIIVWDIPLILYASFCGNIAIITRQEKKAARIYTLNAIFNIVCNLIFIPKFGYLAAAVIAVTTDFISAAQFYFLLRGQFNFPNLPSLLIRTIVAAGIMGFVVWIFPIKNIFLSIGIGGAFYFILLFILRIPDQFEKGLIQSALRKVKLIKV
jgi:O-antigen/teichoic acid export membrane protein